MDLFTISWYQIIILLIINMIAVFYIVPVKKYKINNIILLTLTSFSLIMIENLIINNI